MPVIIQNPQGKVIIPDECIEVFESVMGPVTLFLQGKTLGNEGAELLRELGIYKVGDIVKIVDSFKYQHSGVYEIVNWNLSSNNDIHEFDLGFKHK